jgi:hypothetical protein
MIRKLVNCGQHGLLGLNRFSGKALSFLDQGMDSFLMGFVRF